MKGGIIGGMIGGICVFLKATRKRAQKTFHVSSGNDHRYRYAIDDAAVDHVDQYWLGGKTRPENARLTTDTVSGLVLRMIKLIVNILEKPFQVCHHIGLLFRRSRLEHNQINLHWVG